MITPLRANRYGRLAAKEGKTQGFSLVEILVVVAIMVIVIALSMGAMNGLKGAGDATKSVYDIKGTLDQARAYALANNTYVWVGFFEEDGSKTSTSPATSGTGRVVIATVASKDGTRIYDPTSPPALISSTTPLSNYLTPIGKLQKFDNLHLASLNGINNQSVVSAIPSTSGMSRPVILDNGYDLGNAACCPSPGFAGFYWPLTAANAASSQYTFLKVINFNPQGMAHIQYATNTGFIPLYMEIGLQTTHGNVAVSSTNQAVGNQAAIQVDGMTGATRIYRP